MSRRKMLVSLSFLMLATGLPVAAQNVQRGGTDENAAGGAQPTPPRPRFNIDAFIDQFMARDADGDGRLSREELPAAMADRFFAEGDTNGDKFIDRDELKAFIAGVQRYSGRTGSGGIRRGTQEEPGSTDKPPTKPDPVPEPPATRPAEVSEGGLKEPMRSAGQAIKALDGSRFDAASKADDLQRVQALQAALLSAKADLARLPMAPQAKERYGTDDAAYRDALRMQLIKAISESLTLETLIVRGDARACQGSIGRLQAIQKDGHGAFKPPVGRTPEAVRREGGDTRRGGGTARPVPQRQR